MEDLSRDKDLLRGLFKSCKDYPDKERYHAPCIVSLGYPVSGVAGLFCRDGQTVRNWVEKWLKERNVSGRPKDGRPDGIDSALERGIVSLAEENAPGKYGMNCSFWDCAELRRFLAMNGVFLSKESIRRVLKRNGFRYVKSDYEYRQADEGKKSRFLREFSGIVGDREAGSSILFMDEMGTLLHPKKGYMWTRERKAIVRTFSSHRKVSVFGAVNPMTGSSESMHHFRRLEKGEFAEKFVEFLERVYGRFRGTIYFILDGLQAHKSGIVKAWLETHPRMRMIFLPPYSPDLNVVEWLWNFSRKKFLDNRVFAGVRQLASSYSWFLRRLPKSVIRRVCNIDMLLGRIT